MATEVTAVLVAQFEHLALTEMAPITVLPVLTDSTSLC
jgi:hypothetical protein